MAVRFSFLTAIFTSLEKRLLISDHIKDLLLQRLKALDRSVETLGLWIVTSSVTFIKSANQSSIKLCLIVHLVAVWTLIYDETIFAFNLFQIGTNSIFFLSLLVGQYQMGMLKFPRWDKYKRPLPTCTAFSFRDQKYFSLIIRGSPWDWASTVNS